MIDEKQVNKILIEDEAERMGYLMPCYAFIDVDEQEQLAKIDDELAEVRKAWNDYERDLTEKARMELLMECADVQEAIETLMMQIGADDQERWEARRKVWEKNNARGYYDIDRAIGGRDDEAGD